MKEIDKLKEIVLDNNYFDTIAGERFKSLYEIKNIQAVISFSGRSRKQECYKLHQDSESDSDAIYVTHLYIDSFGNLKVQLGTEDTDDISTILKTSNEPIENYDRETLREWINLLTF